MFEEMLPFAERHSDFAIGAAGGAIPYPQHDAHMPEATAA